MGKVSTRIEREVDVNRSVEGRSLGRGDTTLQLANYPWYTVILCVGFLGAIGANTMIHLP